MNNYESNFEKALELYKNGMSLTKIQKEIGINRNKLAREFKKLGITIVQNGQKYNYDRNVFKTIDTEEKAYWLGFLYADGYVNDRSIELTLQELDYDHLVKFRKFIGDESIQISYKESVKAYRIYIGCKEIAHDLINLGCVQAKSYVLEFPTLEQVPEYLIHHFMRGYFDGDGSITNNHNQLSFQVLGTNNFLDNYEKYLLENIDREKPNKRYHDKRHSDDTYFIGYYGNKQVKKIFDYLYKDATIYMERKFNKFNNDGGDAA